MIGIYLQFDQPASPIAIESMKKEVAGVMKPAGLRFEWRETAERTTGETFPDLMILHFRGTCDTTGTGIEAHGKSAHSLSLANTAVSDGDVLPFSQIQCDRIRGYILPLIHGEPFAASLFGRALGRVAAHEMYHVFVETKTHGTRGIACQAHRAQDLVAPSFRFDAPEAKQLRAYSARFAQADAIGSTR